MLKSLDLTGRVAVVAGGTSGLGRAVALALADAGADVVPTGRRVEHVETACVEIRAKGRRSLEHITDVGDRRSVDDLRDAVLAEFGRIDVLVNAAGFTFRAPSATMEEQKWSALIDTHLNGALRTCQSFYEPLKASGHGRVINFGSLTSFVGFHEVAAYAAAKSAILGLTRSLACEWAKDGICVNAIAPGVFPTELNRELIMGTPRGNELLMRTPMARFGEAHEIGGVAVLLASDAASFLTGQCIAVDGGFLASGVNC
jgi:NAD(P)-dependent dehydrogenase (short-subunit alcohol dehydrogenase family)